MFVSEYYGLDNEFDKKEVFDCILDKDSPKCSRVIEGYRKSEVAKYDLIMI